MRTSDRFRTAIRAGRFSDADDLLGTIRAEVEAEWCAARSIEQRNRIAEETTALLTWARSVILASRAHTQTKLASLKSEYAYGARAPHRRSRLNVEG